MSVSDSWVIRYLSTHLTFIVNTTFTPSFRLSIVLWKNFAAKFQVCFQLATNSDDTRNHLFHKIKHANSVAYSAFFPEPGHMFFPIERGTKVLSEEACLPVLLNGAQILYDSSAYIYSHIPRSSNDTDIFTSSKKTLQSLFFATKIRPANLKINKLKVHTNSRSSLHPNSVKNWCLILCSNK